MKIYEYHINGRIPSKKNSRITNKKTGRSFPSAKYYAWEKMAMEQIKCLSELPDKPIEKCKMIHVNIYYPDFRVADNSNKFESVMDMLVKVGILKDDCWTITGKTSQSPIYRKNNGGANILVYVDDDVS